MPVQPSVRESEEEMEAGKESHLPETNGELEQQRESERGGEETMDESTEDRESDLDESEEQEEEESSGKSAQTFVLLIVSGKRTYFDEIIATQLQHLPCSSSVARHG